MNLDWRVIVNGVLFQLGWFACVLGGNDVAIAATSAIIAFHVIFIGYPREWILILLVASVGVIVDSLIVQAGVIDYRYGEHLPTWMACIWLLFASTVCHSLRFFSRSVLGAAATGLLLVPVSYYAGVRFGAAFIPAYSSLLVIGVSWAVMLPIFFRWAVPFKEG